MASLHGRTVRVAGAGALGLAVAIEAARAGATVSVHDPAPGDNASAVAAGMLAPVYEAVLDPVSAGHFPLLMAARDAWPGFAERTGVMLDRSGALYSGARALAVRAALARLGMAGEARSGGLFTAEDWRIEARPALDRLRQTARDLGVSFRMDPVQSAEAGTDTIAATGWRPVDWAPESSVISPIKGQILRLSGHPPLDGPVARRDGGYIAPSRGGAIYGATMEPGRSDLAADEAIDTLVDHLHPAWRTVGAMARVEVGVRGASPDGLPLVGPSRAPGVWLAMGARRNGWLMAPLVAGMMRAYLAGEDTGPWAPMMDARRFAAPDGTED